MILGCIYLKADSPLEDIFKNYNQLNDPLGHRLRDRLTDWLTHSCFILQVTSSLSPMNSFGLLAIDRVKNRHEKSGKSSASRFAFSNFRLGQISILTK